MQHHTVYNKWLPQWLKLPLLIVALFPHLMLLSLFHSNTAFTASFLDVDSDDLQYLLMLMYGTIVSTLLITPRLMAYFSVKAYSLLMSSISIILLYVLSIATNYQLILSVRFLEGIFGILEGAIFLPIIIAELKTKNARIIAYCILYGYMLTGGSLTAAILKTSIENYTFQQMITIIAYVHILVLIIVMLLFNNNRFFPKIPLYQLDMTSSVFLWLSLQTGVYAVIFGKRLMWLESDLIVTCIFVSIISGAIFIIKQLTSKRPSFLFEIFAYRNVVIGLVLFFIFYVTRASTNNVYNVMATVWNWPWDYIITIQYINVAGTVLGFIISGYCLMKNVSSKLIFFSGFSLLALVCAWFTYVFYPDTTLATITPPLFLQGVAQGFLFTPLVMYIITGLPNELVYHGTTLGTTVRFWGTAIGYALMQNALLILTTKHTNTLSDNLIPTNPIFYEQWTKLFDSKITTLTQNDALRTTAGSFKTRINEEAILLSNMEIFTFLFYIATFTALFILVYQPAKIAIRNIFVR